MSRKPWRWKVEDSQTSAGLGLLYEPGNWGDVLKGLWALRIARFLGARPLRLADPFAGRATYPVTASAERRFAAMPDNEFVRAQSPFLRERLIASTGRLLLAECQPGSTSLVCDVDAGRRASWIGITGATISAAAGGEELLREQPDVDLILIDPYDLIDRWPRLSKSVLCLAPRALVVLYAYSKAPRGSGHARAYAAFRRALAEGIRGTPGLRTVTGRLPSDERFPRAYHEVIVLGSDETLEHLIEPLREVTLPLARRLAEEGAFETP